MNPKDGVKVQRKETSKYGLGVFAIEDIQAEELISSFDGEFYNAPDMSEDSNFKMNCLCGKPACRGVVGAFHLLSLEQKVEFLIRCDGFISQWLVIKYKLY